ncbi:MAG: membrane protein insertion efficiency factor YidD [Ghiorsea sp.]
MFAPLNKDKAELGSAFFVRYPALKGMLYLYAGLMVASLLLGMFWKTFDMPTTSPQGFAIHFYQHVLGHLDGRACPAYPVCSAYAKEAIAEHGALVGSWLMMDRLIHETDDLKLGTWVIWKGEKRLYDPLNRNDFWLEEAH